MAEAAPLDTLEAATIWRDRALLDDKGLFTDADVWTMVNLRALWVALTRERCDLRRLESLGEQLRDADPAVVRLAAELFWVMYLASGSNCISHTRKTDIIRTIYDWSGETLTPNHPLLQEVSLSVTGGPGLFFSARRSAELFFLIKAVVGIKKLGGAERRSLLHNPVEMGHMLDEVTGGESLQLNHIVRHLLFPDHYEPLFTSRDKRRIVESFGGIPRKEARRWSVTQLDDELASIRKLLQPLYGDQTISFQQEPLVSTWRQGNFRGEIPSCEQRFWVEKSPFVTRPDRQSGADRLGNAIWSPRQASDESAALMREIEPGDIIFHLTDNDGISGVSVVAEEIETEFVCPEGSPWEGQPGFRLSLRDFKEVTPTLDQNALLLDPKFQDRLKELAGKHPSLFFNKQLTLNRGHYLSEAPERLVQIFNESYHQESNRHLPHLLLPDPEDLTNLTRENPDRVQHPMAQLLYGSPGTGKTYTAMVRAVEICDGSAPGNHDQLVARYIELQEAARIQLITFHPSFGYHQFIEGAEPVDRESGGEASGSTRVQPGLLKTLAARASLDSKSQSPVAETADCTIWKITSTAKNDGIDARTAFLDGGFIVCPEGGELDFGSCSTRAAVQSMFLEAQPDLSEFDESVSAVDQIVNRMTPGDLVILTDQEGAWYAIGQVKGDYRHRASYQTGVGEQTFFQTRPVQWLNRANEPQNWRSIARKKFLPRTLYRLDASLIRMDALTPLIESDAAQTQNYVLIIDEIGQGNVAEIFGELITLIEPDKRNGRRNPLAVTLPFSGECFSLPENLFFIATLNSTDSVNALNTDILNRRFEFEELAPDASLIRGDDQLGMIPDGDGGRIDLRSLMLTINRRIEFLADRDHRLGQGFFMQIRSFEDLLQAIRARILPHLRTLFDDDWHKVQLVLSDVNLSGAPNVPQIVAHEEMDPANVLGFAADEMAERTRYWITPDREMTPDAFRKIYSEI